MWTSQYAVYDSMSSHMQKYLEGLTARHSSELQAQGSRELGRAVRRDPVTTEHPIIRTNPVTGWNSVFFNPGFVTDIVGVPKVESNAIINYLNEIISTTQELHVRFQWHKNDVAFWDNRVCVRSSNPTCISEKLTADRTTRHLMGLPLIVVMLFGSLHKRNARTLTQPENPRRKNYRLDTDYQRSTRMERVNQITMTSRTSLSLSVGVDSEDVDEREVRCFSMAFFKNTH